jgi:predicted MFS family arabinose efflux permease
MNTNLVLMVLCQGLFFTNNVTFIAINGLVGLSLAPVGWMATLPVMGYVVGAALFTPLVAWSQKRWGRKTCFLLGLAVAFISALLCTWAAWTRQFGLLVMATVLAGYYSANGQLYRFAAAELAAPGWKEKAVSWVLAGGLIGAVAGPNIAKFTRNMLEVPFAGAYLALAGVALLGLVLMSMVSFAPAPEAVGAGQRQGPVRSNRELLGQPAFLVAVVGAALGYGVMNLLMAATPLAMQTCGFPFDDAALVLEWHVIGMFAPGFFTGHLIKRYGPQRIMSAGVALNLVCISIALTGQELHQFLGALFLLGVGWNFLFTASTTLSLQTYTAAEKDRAQGIINFAMFVVMAVSSFSSGALVMSRGWFILNLGSLVPLALMVLALVWLAMQRPTS